LINPANVTSKQRGTRKEADAFLIQARHEVAGGVHTAASKSPTVAAAGEAWIEQGEADGLEPSTIRQYRQHLSLHIAPFIGKMKLADLTPAAVADFREQLRKAGRSPAMQKRAVGSLGALLADAIARGQVQRNAVRDATRSTRRHARLQKRHQRRLEVGVDIPSKDEIRAMIGAAKGRWRPLIITAVFTGLRASELRGLRWADINLNSASLTVRQRADRWNTIGSPKTDASKRDVPLAPLAVNALREWRLACPMGDHDLIFPNRRGGVLALVDIHRHGLRPLQRAASVRDYGMHALRHAAASLFIEQGFGPKRIQALMGHSSIQVTFDVYGHLFPAPADDQAAMAQLQARLVG
jgi:integrase